MMYQKIIVPIDHGNRNMKIEHKIFTFGFVEGDCRPALGGIPAVQWALPCPDRAADTLHEGQDAGRPFLYPDAVCGGDRGGKADVKHEGQAPSGSAAGGTAAKALRRALPEV